MLHTSAKKQQTFKNFVKKIKTSWYSGDLAIVRGSQSVCVDVAESASGLHGEAHSHPRAELRAAGAAGVRSRPEGVSCCCGSPALRLQLHGENTLLHSTYTHLFSTKQGPLVMGPIL